MKVIGFVRDSKEVQKDGNDGTPYTQRTVNVEGMSLTVVGKGPMPEMNTEIEATISSTYIQPKDGETFGRTVYKMQGWSPAK